MDTPEHGYEARRTVRDSRMFIAGVATCLFFGPISHPAALAETTPLTLVQEYVRELGELEDLRAQAESEQSLRLPGVRIPDLKDALRNLP